MNTSRMLNYYEEFRKVVIEGLGGSDMADEFFKMHPHMVSRMRADVIYHENKGASPRDGANAFLAFKVKPRLQIDRMHAPNL